MSLQNVVERVRQDCHKVLAERRLSQQEFAEKHGLSYSWLNKFLKGRDTDYRIGSVEDLRLAVQQEKRAS
jgi:predicted transcriptional regulator